MTATFFTGSNEKKSGNSKNCYSLVKKCYTRKVFAIETAIIDPRSIKVNMAIR